MKSHISWLPTTLTPSAHLPTREGRHAGWALSLVLLMLLGSNLAFAADRETACAPIVAPVAQGPSSTRLTRRPLNTNCAPFGYYEYLPPDYGAAHSGSPLIIVLGGSGMLGNGTTQLNAVIRVGPGLLISQDRWPDDRPFVVLIPQDGGSSTTCTSTTQLKTVIAHAKANYLIDPKRIYLTGLSCGAIRSWAYLAEESNSEVAAIVPIEGNGIAAWETAGCSLGTVAIWAFHNEFDKNRYTPLTGSAKPIKRINSCASPHEEALLTIYPVEGHDAWTSTYDGSAGHDVYGWMLTHEKY